MKAQRPLKVPIYVDYSVVAITADLDVIDQSPNRFKVKITNIFEPLCR